MRAAPGFPGALPDGQVSVHITLTLPPEHADLFQVCGAGSVSCCLGVVPPVFVAGGARETSLPAFPRGFVCVSSTVTNAVSAFRPFITSLCCNGSVVPPTPLTPLLARLFPLESGSWGSLLGLQCTHLARPHAPVKLPYCSRPNSPRAHCSPLLTLPDFPLHMGPHSPLFHGPTLLNDF